MKSPLSTALALIVLLVAPLRAADDAVLSAVRKADDARVAAVIAEDAAKLATIYSDELRYCHSSGKVDTKASYLASLSSPNSKRVAMDYGERTFAHVAPDIVLMTGRVVFKSISDGAPTELPLTFLAVWRQERGAWRFLAWQSCKLPPEPAKP